MIFTRRPIENQPNERTRPQKVFDDNLYIVKSEYKTNKKIRNFIFHRFKGLIPQFSSLSGLYLDFGAK